MTRLPLLALALAVALLAGLGRAQDPPRPIVGTTPAGRTWRGTLEAAGDGAARVLVARLEVDGLGPRTLRLAAPGAGALPAVRVVERAPGLAGAVAAGAAGAVPAGAPGGEDLALEVVPGARAFTVAVDDATRGAYFRKVTSGPSPRHRGLEARGRLPRVVLDAGRWHTPADGEAAHTEGPLDRPSVYLGGRAGGRELDCGLTWDRVFDPAGRPTFTDAEVTDGRDPARRFVVVQASPLVLVDGVGRRVEGEAARALRARCRANFAFRPFWRTTNADEGNRWGQPAVGAADNVYFYPGEPVVLRVEAVGPERVRLEVLRPGDDGPRLVRELRQQGFGRGLAQRWKRVNALDQFREVVEGGGRRLRRGNEGRDVLPTRARALGALWDEVVLLRDDGARLPVVGPAFVEVRGGDTAGRYDDVFRRSPTTGRGGETLDVVPPGP